MFAAPTLLFARAPADGSPADGSPALLVPLVAATALALLARRRAPVTVLGAVTGLTVLAVLLTGSLSGFDLAVAFAVYPVAAVRPPWFTWMSLGASAAVLTPSVLLWATDRDTSELAGLALLMFAALAIGTSVRNRRLHVTELVDRGNALAREAEQTALLATAEERARIAREMHDVVAHSLSVMIALADGASASIERSPASARAAVDAASTTGRAALADMRRMLGVLRDGDAAFDPAPGGMDLEALVQSFRSAGMAVELVITGPPLPRDTGLQLAVYRIVQESLTNALRHTDHAGRVSAAIAYAAGTVRIQVTDDGGLTRTARVPVPRPAAGAGAIAPGPSASAAPGSGTLGVGTAAPAGAQVSSAGGRGVIGMRERAAIYDGSVVAGPSGAGWRVDAVLHWSEEES